MCMEFLMDHKRNIQASKQTNKETKKEKNLKKD